MDPDWACLPKHILDLVIKKLDSSFDYVQFGAVCLQWHSTLKDSDQIKRGKISQYHHVPMLLVPGEEDTWSPYNVMENKFYNLKLSIPHNRRFSGSSQGWLIAVNIDWTVTLYKPFAMVEKGNNADYSIHLPCLFPPHLGEYFNPDNHIDLATIHDYYIQKFILTADPLTNPNECTVVVLFGDSELAMLRITKDTTWTKIYPPDHEDEFIMSNIHDILHHKNQIYILSWSGLLMSFDVTNSSNPAAQVVAPDLPFHSVCIKRYLVESFQGELLQIQRQMTAHSEPEEFRKTRMFRMFKLDFKRKKWIKIKSLGRLSLFLGENSSISVLASSFIGCKPNSIYFTHDLDEMDLANLYALGQNPVICDVGIYDVESRNFNFHYTIDSNFLVKMSRRPPIWVVPTLTIY